MRRRVTRFVAALAVAGVAVVEAAPPASQIGSWEAPRKWPVVGIHAMVLATGEVMHYAYEEARGPEENRVYYEGSRAKIWNPETDKFKDVSWESNVFCSGHSFLADGKIFVTGGIRQEGCPTEGREETFLFDPFTREWTAYEPMRLPRYYPTNLTLGDGSVMILSGNNSHCKLVSAMEIMEPGEGIRVVKEGKKVFKLYPRVHLLPDGRVVNVGVEPRTLVFDTTNPSEGWVGVARTNHGEYRWEGTSFQIPGDPFKVMICGGFETYEGDRPTDTCEVIDFSEKKPQWRYTAPMSQPRGHANAVLLPDGKVLVVGGGGHNLYDDPVRQAEIFDPETGRWSPAGLTRWGRMYHSTAVLIPDGRVISAGQDDVPGGASGAGAFAEFYRPPYLHRGKRPRIKQAVTTLEYGGEVQMKLKPGKQIEKVVLIRPSAVTHSVNSTQRYVPLEFELIKGARVTVYGPTNPNEAPPGYYMLFAVNRAGVPSEAVMVQVVPPAPVEEETP
ncbi:MAG: galactose oxidase-like domain-containing protein [Thermoanaerobaculia bacterium]|nr:galactose oxidase-like domain-containing protein [Thermoanaerobaculia bacterium]